MTQRRYETIVILNPDISEEERESVFERIGAAISQGNGFLVLRDDWGNRKLAYEVKKKPRGFYTRFDFCGSGAIVDEIERFCRIDDRVMKYLTVLIDEAADVEQIKEAAGRAESEEGSAAEEDHTADAPAPEVSETAAEDPTEAAETVTTETADTANGKEA
jgi:small subunit ribosomal protein S6